MKAAGDNIQSAAGNTGDAAADNFDAAKNDARSAVRSLYAASSLASLCMTYEADSSASRLAVAQDAVCSTQRVCIRLIGLCCRLTTPSK